MGWISKRFNQNRSKWGRPMSEDKRRAPLRKIAYFERRAEHLFDHHVAVLECGHRVLCYGETKARCTACLEVETPVAGRVDPID